MTYTYAVLEVSPQVFREVQAALLKAGYSHAFHHDEGKVVIDMHGIALKERGTDAELPKSPRPPTGDAA